MIHRAVDLISSTTPDLVDQAELANARSAEAERDAPCSRCENLVAQRRAGQGMQAFRRFLTRGHQMKRQRPRWCWWNLGWAAAISGDPTVPHALPRLQNGLVTETPSSSELMPDVLAGAHCQPATPSNRWSDGTE